MKKVIAHFRRVDPLLHSVLLKVEPLEKVAIQKSDTYFTSLCRSIINQQLSNKVGKVIFERFKNLLKDNISPDKILKIPDEKIREIGISYTKIKYIKDLADKIYKKEIKLNKLVDMDEDELVEHLTSVKGIGIWTVEMFSMNCLGKEDIFSFGDLGLKRALEKLYKLKNPKKEEIEQIIMKWSPYKTYASKILWKSLSI